MYKGCTFLRKFLKVVCREGPHIYIIQTVKWTGLFASDTVGPIILKDIVTVECYLHVIRGHLLPSFMVWALISRNQVFRRIWCNCIATHIVADVLNKQYQLVLSSWFPAYFEYGLPSVHLNQCEFFLWDFHNYTVYGNNSP